MLDVCLTCLKQSETKQLLPVDNSESIGIRIKLQECIPEIDWNISFKICKNCIDELNRLHAFKELCVQSFKIHQLQENNTKEQNVIPEVTNAPLPFICFHCNLEFKLKTLLEIHIDREHSNKPKRRKKDHFCSDCDEVFTTFNDLVEHRKECSSRKSEEDKVVSLPTCTLCGTIFRNKYLLRRHLRCVHATEKKYECEECGRRFVSFVYLNAHKRYHSGERSHICSFCGKAFITTSDLSHHEKTHENKRAYRCEICPKAFNTSSDLHKHKICVHSDRSLWKFECSYCQRRFPLKTNLDTHTKIHTGEKNFACHLCERRCINKSALKRHMETHTNGVSFRCEFCNQIYKYKKSLKLHMVKVHENDGGDVKEEEMKKFFCTLCSKTYCGSDNLEQHMRSHTSQCTKCGNNEKEHLKNCQGVKEKLNLFIKI